MKNNTKGIGQWFEIIINTSISILLISILMATVDHYFLNEEYRHILKIVGIFSLCVFGAGVVTTVLFRKKL